MSARKILDEILPFFDHLQFLPIPLDAPRSPVGAQVHLQDVGTAASSLAAMRPNRRILAQKEAVNVRAALHDRVVALFLETVIDDWPASGILQTGRRGRRRCSQRTMNSGCVILVKPQDG
jgi:hypothetical protein